VLRALTDWIDQFPVWGVVATAFVVGSALGVALRIARRGKWEEKERREIEREAAKAAKAAKAATSANGPGGA
jgi:hypothetical protein